MKKILLTSALWAIAISIVPSKANALTFDFNLDDTFDETVTEPFVGEGTFSFDGDLEDGTYALESLSNFDFNFSFTDGSSFTNADILTPIEEVLVIVSTTETERKVQFSNVNPFGSTELFGSLDFANFDNGTFLSFEPPGIGGDLNLYSANEILGTYNGVAVSDSTGLDATPVPEFDSPGSLLGIGALGVGLTLFRRKNQKSVTV
jgi:hypothetical protein